MESAEGEGEGIEREEREEGVKAVITLENKQIRRYA